jgi:SET domain-containing protein
MGGIQIQEGKFGKGLFAKEYIPMGTVLLLFVGPLISFEEAARREHGYPLQIAKDTYIDLSEPGKFGNHSCNPNAGIKNDRSLITLRDIQKGEEIYYDYSTTMDEAYWTMTCLCGSSICRTVVQDFKHLSPERQRFYLQKNLVQNFIAKDYLARTEI